MAAEKRNRILHLLPLIIFLSGFAALVYQVVWIKEFSLLFGTQLLSTSTVLTVFMAGLSIGALLFGRLSDKLQKPVWLLIFIQAGISLFAFFFQPVFQLITNLYISINQSGTWLAGMPNLSRFLLSVPVLIIPTVLMGGTLPVVVKLYTENLAHLGNRTGSLYSLNNAGAFAGGLLSGFFLLRLLGSYQTNMIAAFINLLNAMLLVWVAAILPRFTRPLPLKSPGPGTGNERHPGRTILKVVLVITAVEGFTMLVYEILWTRTVLEFSYDKSSYVYTTVILGFLFGLSSGSFLSRKRIDKWQNPVEKFAFVEFGAGLTSLLAFILFSYLSTSLFNARLANSSWFHASGRDYIVFFILTSVPAFFMGISYPLVGKIITGNIRVVGSRMGLLSFADTIGSVAGPAVAGFIMLRFMDVYQGFIICVLLNAGSGIFLFIINKKKVSLQSKILPVTAVASLIVILILFTRSDYYRVKASLYPGEDIIAMEEGMTATVVVSKLPSNYMALSINGAKTAFTNPEDQRVHKMLAYLPWFFNPGADNAAVIGFGLGITTRCLAELDINTTVAELSPEVLKLSNRYFSYVNHGIASSGKADIFVEDGRSVLLRSRKKFDIITTNAVHPRLGANLYSSDFYALCRERLTDSGTVCQWIPTNWMSEGEFKSLVRAFTVVFPYARIWYVNRAHLLIIGSMKPLDIDYGHFKSLFYRRNVYNELIDVDLTDPANILAGFFMDNSELRDWVSSTEPDTDNKPVIEYSFVTDPRPDQGILLKLVNNRPDFSKVVDFGDTIEKEHRNYILERIERNYTEHISYLRNLNHDLAAADSLRN